MENVRKSPRKVGKHGLTEAERSNLDLAGGTARQ